MGLYHKQSTICRQDGQCVCQTVKNLRKGLSAFQIQRYVPDRARRMVIAKYSSRKNSWHHHNNQDHNQRETKCRRKSASVIKSQPKTSKHIKDDISCKMSVIFKGFNHLNSLLHKVLHITHKLNLSRLQFICTHILFSSLAQIC